MSSNRLIMQGKLQELKEQRRKLTLRADSLMESITADLTLYEVTKLVDIDTERVRVLSTELDEIKQEVLELDTHIQKLRDELG
ncbi:MAG: hypothetical protein AB7E76_02775 [Deferribacterales bacterium]